MSVIQICIPYIGRQAWLQQNFSIWLLLNERRLVLKKLRQTNFWQWWSNNIGDPILWILMSTCVLIKSTWLISLCAISLYVVVLIVFVIWIGYNSSWIVFKNKLNKMKICKSKICLLQCFIGHNYSDMWGSIKTRFQNTSVLVTQKCYILYLNIFTIDFYIFRFAIRKIMLLEFRWVKRLYFDEVKRWQHDFTFN